MKKSEKPFIPLLKIIIIAKREDYKVSEQNQLKTLNLKQIIYRKSLKNYTFDYPQHDLHRRCVNRPTYIKKMMVNPYL